ncbi:hypothetical protein ABZY93_11600 [Streptomyces smyrnaeus]|uniref:hypothetical protein n=1 Tax=Streptomyces smyrnaeus TaxID=1387713 RepID=UPI0033B78299
MVHQALTGRRRRLSAGLLGGFAVAATLAAAPPYTTDPGNRLPVLCSTAQGVDVFVLESPGEGRSTRCDDLSDNDTWNETSFT